MSHTRIIGLGNAILSDDAAGLIVIRLLREYGAFGPEIDLVETEVAGFDLLDLIVGYQHIILVDTILFYDTEPGTIFRIDPSDLRTSIRLRSVHEIDLPTVLALGKQLGLPMPSKVEVYAIQAGDTWTFSEKLTPPVEKAVRRVSEEIITTLES